MSKIKNWVKRSYADSDSYDNTKSNVTLTYVHRKDNVYVTLRGRGRYQAQFLVGGNSGKIVVSSKKEAKSQRNQGRNPITKEEARKIVMDYMRRHPNG